MSLVQWLFKSKKKMAEPATKRVKVGGYTISSHAQNRISSSKRQLAKKDVLINLFGKSKNSDIYLRDGQYQFDRVNDKNRTVTHITKKGKVVKTIHKYHNNKNGRKTAYKNFKGGE